MDNYTSLAFKQYLKRFGIMFAITLAFVAAFVCIKKLRPHDEYTDPYEVLKPSTNYSRVYGDQRVFDYGDQLTDDEEKQLTERIHEAEYYTQCDIVIVTLNESLKDFAPEYKANYTMTITPEKYVMVYADKFWEDNKFGYDCPQRLDGSQDTGDGVLLVDNNFREPETGKKHTWMCTTGRAETSYSSAGIDHALDEFYYRVDYDYFGACNDFVDQVERDLSLVNGSGSKNATPVYKWVIVVAVAIFLIKYNANISAKEGVKTTTETTYTIGNGAQFSVTEDIFTHKDVKKVYNPPSSSSSGGGGGHHSSGGGGSHGGGGHSR